MPGQKVGDYIYNSLAFARAGRPLNIQVIFIKYILDNLQFMLPRSMGGKMFRSGFEKFDLQDIAIEKFRKFATEKKVNIILVVHPRKETEASVLDISSVFGTAKATQEADIVLILQGRKGR